MHNQQWCYKTVVWKISAPFCVISTLHLQIAGMPGTSTLQMGCKGMIQKTLTTKTLYKPRCHWHVKHCIGS